MGVPPVSPGPRPDEPGCDAAAAEGHVIWPPVADGAICLSSTQLALLLDGLAWSQAAAPVVKKPVLVG
jgi:hypothetical protein